jgi:hypothetical protein
MAEQKSLDLLLINLPWWEMNVAPLAPAILKGILEDQSYLVKTRDFNVDLLEKFCKNNRDKYNDVGNYFVFGLEKYQKFVNDYYNYIIDELEKYSFRYIGISVFSVYTHKATLELCSLIKERHPEYKIILGGRGAGVNPYLSIMKGLSSVEKLLTFSQILKKKNLIETSILGDGEDALSQFLANDKQADDNNYNVVINKKLEYPFSNFDDYDLGKYTVYGDKKQIPVFSSKGCVRDCDFCDVAAQFKRYSAKDGERLAKEMIYLAEKYNLYDFSMADSILNGNLKELKRTCNLLKNYNDTSKNKIKWAGNWIARPPGALKREMFDLLRDAGLEAVTIFAESGSYEVLEAINKKTTVEGLYYELEHLQRCGIQATINNVIAHWSESYKNFLEHIDMIIELGPYVANKTIVEINLGSTFSILDDTPAVTGPAKIISIGENFSHLWYTKKNPSLTLKSRLARWYSMMVMSVYLKYWISRPLNVSLTVLAKLNDKKAVIDFYNKVVDKSSFIQCQSINDMNNIIEIVDNRIKDKFKTSKLKIKVNAESVNGAPNFVIGHNNGTILNTLLPDGISEFEFTIENSFDFENTIQLSLTNKGLYDTEVDEKGNIIKNKKIEILSLSIDNVDLTKDPEYFYKNLTYTENEVPVEVKQGFYSNATLHVNFQAVFWKHYLNIKNNKLTWRTTFSDLDDRFKNTLEQIKKEIQSLPF